MVILPRLCCGENSDDFSFSPRQPAGASIPLETMMNFPPVSDFPLFFEKFSDCGKFSLFYPFLVIFFSHRPQILNFPPYFPCFSTFPPLFRENYYSPLLFKISSYFRKIHLLFTYFLCISFPPTLTMMHLYITQCTYWTPLPT